MAANELLLHLQHLCNRLGGLANVGFGVPRWLLWCGHMLQGSARVSSALHCTDESQPCRHRARSVLPSRGPVQHRPPSRCVDVCPARQFREPLWLARVSDGFDGPSTGMPSSPPRRRSGFLFGLPGSLKRCWASAFDAISGSWSFSTTRWASRRPSRCSATNGRTRWPGTTRSTGWLRAPGVDPAEFDRASHDEAWG